MTRLDIVYDGHPYSIAGDADELKARILTATQNGEVFWLTVNEGAGTLKPVELLINASTRISIATVDAR